MQIFHEIKFDLIITLTNVLMDNFCPCLTFKYKYCLSFAYDDRDQKSKKNTKKIVLLFSLTEDLCDKYFVIKV